MKIVACAQQIQVFLFGNFWQFFFFFFSIFDPQFLESTDSETTNTEGWLCLYIPRVKIREGNGNPFQYSCLENPMDGGAW